MNCGGYAGGQTQKHSIPQNTLDAPVVDEEGVALDGWRHQWLLWGNHTPSQSGKDTKLAQKLSQFQHFMAVFLRECMGQLAPFGRT
jgi:hypothetical protein